LDQVSNEKFLKGEIHEKIRLRRSKLGFPTPESKWLKTLSSLITKIFNSDKTKAGKYLDYKKITKEFNKFVEGDLSEVYSDIFWRILNLEMWLQIFFQKKIYKDDLLNKIQT
jgi:asparagine synthase (glutamine-hydrolysing)